MRNSVIERFSLACKELFNYEGPIDLERAQPEFGDYATPVALRLARQQKTNPRELAERLVELLSGQDDLFDSVSVAGAGYVNIRLSDTALNQERTKMLTQNGVEYGRNQRFNDQVVIVEYSDPNPFKVLHAGHLYTTVAGDAIANLIEYAGGQVHAVNFGGDVGRHVGITMWEIIRRLEGEYPEKLTDIAEHQRADWLASAYIEGTRQFENDQKAQSEMLALNKKIYKLHEEKDHDSPLAKIYWTCRTWSYEYFDAFYERLGSRFADEKQAGNKYYYPESEVAALGLETVKSHLGTIFQKSDGAVVFDGEAHGLHTRVFINSDGIPTYETKDVGLVLQKKQDFNFNLSVVITGNEQLQYMSVVLKAIEQFAPELAQATVHLTHGIVKLAGGEKMSSRKGNILRAVDMLEAAVNANQALGNEANEQVTLGAVKYSLLKSRLGGDIIYDPRESVSLYGNSGPYLQYAYVRALKIMQGAQVADTAFDAGIEPGERTLLVKLTEYPEVIDRACEEFAPHYVCTYLYELAQVFNQFYEHNRVLGDAREQYRLTLVSAYSGILKSGLKLLGIQTPKAM